MTYPLDVSVLLVAAWDRQIETDRARKWIAGTSTSLRAITELGFINGSSSSVYGATKTRANSALSDICGS